MLKLLMGGSPCQKWSIAQKNGRETKPEGEGWELFKNFLIAKEEYRPDYFLYENNKSMAEPIKEQITKEFGVEPILINSALVSAQNRQRYYWTNIKGVRLPEDRGILLRDILDSGGGWREKAYTLDANYWKTSGAALSTQAGRRKMAAEPVRVGAIENDAENQDHDSRQYRVYSPDGKAVTLCGRCGGVGAKTGLYACPHRMENIAVPSDKPVYEVRNGLISIKEKQYPIKLRDGYYIIRKLTVTECKRLQTVPEEYIMPCSASQNYKMLGNGWTVDVIAHILSCIPNIKHDAVEVLSMYDGMSCGHIALDKLGAEITRYYAAEIDKYAIQTTMANYPDTIQLGDAFGVRDGGWVI